MNRKENFEQLAGAYGYAPVMEIKKTPMWSYINADSGIRINYYWSTGSMTAQVPPDKDHPYGKMVLNEKNIIKEIDFENCLIKLK